LQRKNINLLIVLFHSLYGQTVNARVSGAVGREFKS